MGYKLYGKECSTNWRWVPYNVASILPGNPAKIAQGKAPKVILTDTKWTKLLSKPAKRPSEAIFTFEASIIIANGFLYTNMTMCHVLIPVIQIGLRNR